MFGSIIWRNAFIALIALTAFISASFMWNLQNLKNQATYLATEEAQSNWNKDQAFRRWATRHGGLYVKPDERTPPNPYLNHLSHRDVETTDGVKLTLMNPAYMMSQMTKEFEAMYGIKGKITGQILLNPANEADPWELMALQKFDNGAKEVIEPAEINGQPYLRLMKPMVMTEGCVLCHGHLGFKEGDIRGGVSVSIPLSPYLEAAEGSRRFVIFGHLGSWFVGVLLIGVFVREAFLRESERNKIAQIKDEFISTVSHELRTPLTSIHGSLGLLNANFKAEMPNKAEVLLELAARNSETLINLVNDLLDLEKIQSGQFGLKMDLVDIGKLIQQSIEMNQSYADKMGVSISISETGSSPLMVKADEKRVNQILANLISNAAKFSPEGEQVVLSWRKQLLIIDAQPVNGVRISVTDKGPGIPEEFQSQIFNRFTQADSTTTRKTGGTGLGLTICKILAKQHGGDISFETEQGKGTVFHLDLPLA